MRIRELLETSRQEVSPQLTQALSEARHQPVDIALVQKLVESALAGRFSQLEVGERTDMLAWVGEKLFYDSSSRERIERLIQGR